MDKSKKLKIDPDFRDLLPPLSKQQKNELEQLILNEGCRDAILTWKGYIIDGHNRYSICTKHNIEFQTIELAFKDKDDVIIWMISTQAARRNLTEQQLSYLRGLQYNKEKKRDAPNSKGINQHTKEVDHQNEGQPTTAERVAEQHKVSSSTVERDGKFAEAVDKIAKDLGNDVKKKILNKEIKLPKKDIVEIADLTIEEKKEIVSDVEKYKENKVNKNTKAIIENGVVFLPETSDENKKLNEIGIHLKTKRSGEDNLNVDFEIQAIEGTAKNVIKSLHMSIFDNGIDLDKFLLKEHYEKIKNILEYTKSEIENYIIKMEEKINESK